MVCRVVMETECGVARAPCGSALEMGGSGAAVTANCSVAVMGGDFMASAVWRPARMCGSARCVQCGDGG